jgi:hypothetical protein
LLLTALLAAIPGHINSGAESASANVFAAFPSRFPGSVIYMDNDISRDPSSAETLRERRYTIRFAFAADAELFELASGKRVTGVPSDISMGGCFVCTKEPFPLKARLRATFRFKKEVVEALAGVRVFKPRVGMGLEFLDLPPSSHEVLARWISELQKGR